MNGVRTCRHIQTYVLKKNAFCPLFISFSLCLSLCLSLYLSLSLFYTHTHNLSLTHSFAHTHTHSLSHNLSPTHTLSLSLSHTLSLPLTHTLSVILLLGSANHLAPNDSSPDDKANFELGREMVTYAGTFNKEILYPGKESG